jgi:heme-degrading monooxygenase HmoA
MLLRMGGPRPDDGDPPAIPMRLNLRTRKLDRSMYAVIFEVEPEPDRVQEYLDIAARLRPELEKIEGFISIERFMSLSQDGKILSLSFWRDEDAIARWREQEQHHAAQISGSDGVFRDYRIRVAVVVRDYGMYVRAQAPQAMPQVAHKRA